MAGEPWTQKELAAFLRCGVKTARLLDPPRVELLARGSERPLVRYDSDEVRAWWAERVAEARRLREQGGGAVVPPATPRRRRPAAHRRNDSIVLECVNPADVRKAS